MSSGRRWPFPAATGISPGPGSLACPKLWTLAPTLLLPAQREVSPTPSLPSIAPGSQSRCRDLFHQVWVLSPVLDARKGGRSISNVQPLQQEAGSAAPSPPLPHSPHTGGFPASEKGSQRRSRKKNKVLTLPANVPPTVSITVRFTVERKTR